MNPNVHNFNIEVTYHALVSVVGNNEDDARRVVGLLVPKNLFGNFNHGDTTDVAIHFLSHTQNPNTED